MTEEQTRRLTTLVLLFNIALMMFGMLAAAWNVRREASDIRFPSNNAVVLGHDFRVQS